MNDEINIRLSYVNFFKCFMSNLKSIVFCLFFLLALNFPMSSAIELNVQEVLSHLYRSSDQMPINDMTLMLEISAPISDDPKKGLVKLTSIEKAKIYFKSGKNLRTEIDYVPSNPMPSPRQEKIVFISDGINAWQLYSNKFYPVKIMPSIPRALYTIPLCIPFGIIHYPQEQNIEKSYTISGTDVIDNMITIVIKIVSLVYPREEIYVFIDKSRWVPLKMTLKKKDSNGKDTIKEVLYKEIKKTDEGRYFPFKLEIYVNGSLSMVIIYTSIAINTGIDDSLFPLIPTGI